MDGIASDGFIKEILAPTGIVLNGPKPYDPQIRSNDLLSRISRYGAIAVGESYMNGEWDVKDLPEFVSRVVRSGVIEKIWRLGAWRTLPTYLYYRFLNPQSIAGSRKVADVHYDIGNDLYKEMLGETMVYSCGYWKDAKTLDEAQTAKLDLACRKLGLKTGDRILDIGCGWGSLLEHAAKHYGVRGVGLTISNEQAVYAREQMQRLPVEIRLQDYRETDDGPYDHLVSIGMFEHVGHGNYRTYFEAAHRLLKDDGLFLLHTIGVDRTPRKPDPWLDKYIFPGGILPSPELVTSNIEKLFKIEDWHNFGYDYSKTLLAWFDNFDRAWPKLREKYDERFYRMWKFYLLSTAGDFKARHTELWQIVLSPHGVSGGYSSVR
jgi:cyclopropane-fatty-acyl-phospholipid synthase